MEKFLVPVGANANDVIGCKTRIVKRIMKRR